MDFHGGSKLSKLTYPLKTIYSIEARKQLRKVLDDFKPDVCHLNNFNYQLICPNHMMNNPNTHRNCENCIGGHFSNCLKGKCIHGSTAKSVIGMLEAWYWNTRGTYQYIDTMICCSEFLKTKMDTNPVFAGRTVAMHNFVDAVPKRDVRKKNYVLYFGRYSIEKGIDTLIQVCKDLPDISFVFAGTGPLEDKLSGIPNIKNVGFRSGQALERLIREARFSVYSSEWYENCPFSVMESQMYGTPVVGADIGGIPELIKPGETGELFESGNGSDLKEKIQTLWNDAHKLNKYTENCRNQGFASVEQYCERLMKIYGV